MLFTSYAFILFIIVVGVVYYLLPGKAQWVFLLLASYFFYACADPYYLIYILVTTVSTFFAAALLQKRKDAFKTWFAEHKKEFDKDRRKRLKAKQHKKELCIMLCCLLLNLGILAVQKYTNFAIANLNSLFQALGSAKVISFVDLVLPMGISFYTFQTMSYLIDVYRGTIPAEKNPFKLALFVSFFPQLVQGPISRFSDLSKSLFEAHRADYRTISFGIQRILWGFFKKLVIADRMLVAVNEIIQNPDTYQGTYVFIGMLFYAFELYADFTGGIDITIGIAQMLGITVKENFIRPYFSKNVKTYWNRWHITMGTWFTDYIFYPISASPFMLNISKYSRKILGQQIGKRVPIYLVSIIVWFATGIWHGASWNFIVWGLGNCAVILISQELEPFYRWFHKKVPVENNIAYRFFQIVRTILIMSCLRMFDCYRNVPLTFRMFGTMFTRFRLQDFQAESFLKLGLTVADYGVLAAGFCLLLGVSLVQRKGSVREKIARRSYPVRCLVWYGLFLSILLFGAYGIGYNASQFIYNQF